MNSVKLLSICAFIVTSIAGAVFYGADANAMSSIQQGAMSAQGGEGVPTYLFGDNGIITTVTNTLLFIAGSLAVIMIIFGGLRYVTSGGNSNNVTAAKNTILYAIVGLIIAFLSFAVINFILSTLTGAGSSGWTNV